MLQLRPLQARHVKLHRLTQAGLDIGNALIQSVLYGRFARRRTTHLVVVIASLSILAIIQNIPVAVYTANIPQFDLLWSLRVFIVGGNIRLTMTQVLTVVVSIAAYAGVTWFAHRTILGKVDPSSCLRIFPVRDYPLAATMDPYPRHGYRLRTGLPAGCADADGFRTAAI